MKLYVVRHGQTEWNLESRIQGSEDIELTYVGREEAYELQALVADINVDYIYSSPLIRAVETARILADGSVEVNTDERLTERSWGDNEGKLLSEVDTFACWDVNLNTNDNNIERIQDFMHRIADFIEDIKRKHHGKDVLIVAHSAVVRAVHYLLGRIPADGNLSKLNIPNLRIIEYEL